MNEESSTNTPGPPKVVLPKNARRHFNRKVVSYEDLWRETVEGPKGLYGIPLLLFIIFPPPTSGGSFPFTFETLILVPLLALCIYVFFVVPAYRLATFQPSGLSPETYPNMLKAAAIVGAFIVFDHVVGWYDLMISQRNAELHGADRLREINGTVTAYGWQVRIRYSTIFFFVFFWLSQRKVGAPE